MNNRFYVTWREDFDDQEGWFDTAEEVNWLVDRIMKAQKADDCYDENGNYRGEILIYRIIEGVERDLKDFIFNADEE